MVSGGEPFHGAGWILSIVGAVLVLWLYVALQAGAEPFEKRRLKTAGLCGAQTGNLDLGAHGSRRAGRIIPIRLAGAPRQPVAPPPCVTTA